MSSVMNHCNVYVFSGETQAEIFALARNQGGVYSRQGGVYSRQAQGSFQIHCEKARAQQKIHAEQVL